MITDRVPLRNARLVAEIHDDRSVPFLRLYSPREPGRDMLLPLRNEPLCTAMACFTPLGRWHALYWSLAFGHADRVEPSRVSFSCPDRPYRQPRDADLRLFGSGWWLADVEGLYTSVAVRAGTATMGQSVIQPARRA